MNYNRGPKVIATNPRALAKNVSIDTDIIISFDTDIAKSSLGSNIHLTDRHSNNVDAKISYYDKVVTISPVGKLSPNTTYTVKVQGDNDPDKVGGSEGICNPLGYYMIGDHIFTFTTFSQHSAVEQIISGEPNNIIIISQPLIKFKATALTGNDVDTVEVQISSFNNFSKLAWEGKTNYGMVKDTGLRPDIDFGDGQYYWRARVIGATVGDWSETFTFNISSVKESPIVEEDSVPIDVAFPDEWNMLEPSIEEVYPQDNRSSVSDKLKTAYVIIDQIVAAEDLDLDSLYLEGVSVDGSGADHGVVNCKKSVFYNHKKKQTIIALTIPPIDEPPVKEDIIEPPIEDLLPEGAELP